MKHPQFTPDERRNPNITLGRFIRQDGQLVNGHRLFAMAQVRLNGYPLEPLLIVREQSGELLVQDVRTVMAMPVDATTSPTGWISLHDKIVTARMRLRIVRILLCRARAVDRAEGRQA